MPDPEKIVAKQQSQAIEEWKGFATAACLSGFAQLITASEGMQQEPRTAISMGVGVAALLFLKRNDGK